MQYIYFIIAVLVEIFSKIEMVDGEAVFMNKVMIYGIIVMVLVVSVQLIFCEHISNTLLPFLLICCFTLKCYNAFDELIKFAVWGVPVLLALVLRLFILNYQNFKVDNVFKSLIPVAVSVTLGGLGTITFAEYKKSIFFVLGLGIGILMMYYIYSTQYNTDDTYDLTSDYTNTMCLIALFAIFMIVHEYFQNWNTFIINKEFLSFQWRNNISTVLIITMPFVFLTANKYFIWFPVGILSYIAIFFTSSRGGTIFGFFELLTCMVAYFIFANKKSYRIVALAFSVVFAVSFLVFIFDGDYLEQIAPRIFDTLFTPSTLKDEARYKLIFRAKDDFLRNPIFGSGLGYSGNADIYNPVKGSGYFYHSAPLQIFGSLGILGILAYSYQLFMQGKVLWKAKTKFAGTVAISIIFLWGMSVVNPGVFAPIPYAMIIPLHMLVAMRTAENINIKAE